jgi:hypothetical protein
MKWELAIIAATVLVGAGVSRRLTGMPVTPAVVFVLVGPLVFDDVAVTPTGVGVNTLAEATLAVVLFADASRIKPRVLKRLRPLVRHTRASDGKRPRPGPPHTRCAQPRDQSRGMSPARVSRLGCQVWLTGSLAEGSVWAAGRSLPDMSLAFALMAAINGSTGSCATLSHGL